MNILGIIPARGGSKGVPGKNIKKLNGEPLISYSVKEAKKSKYIDRLIVSTDDENIANVVLKYGVEVPFMRPKELAQDNSLAIDNYIYTINRMEKEFNYKVDAIAIFQPTSPLRTVQHIDEAVKLFINKNSDSVVSVCEVEHSPYWYKNMNNKNILSDFISCENSNANRQELPKVYRPNGAIFIFKRELIMNLKTYYTQNSYGYIMSQEDSVDIDTPLDFKIAEVIINERKF